MHTPGPWVTGNTDPLLFGRKQGAGIEPIGFVYGPSHAELSDYGRRTLANARLVASAPDLLSIVMAAIDEIESGDEPGQWYQQAKAVLAKIEGKDQA